MRHMQFNVAGVQSRVFHVQSEHPRTSHKTLLCVFFKFPKRAVRDCGNANRKSQCVWSPFAIASVYCG